MSPRLGVSGLKRTKTKRTVRTANIQRTRRMGFGLTYHEVACVDAAKGSPAWVLGTDQNHTRAHVITHAGFDATPGEQTPLPGYPGTLYRSTDSGNVHPDLVVWEKSRAYRGDPRPQDIIDETAGGALCVGAMHALRIVSIPPDEWTGQTKKPPRHWKIWRLLSAAERAIIANAAGMSARAVAAHIETACQALAKTGRVVGYTHKVHNLLDAAGLFLFVVGRMGKGGKRV